MSGNHRNGLSVFTRLSIVAGCTLAVLGYGLLGRHAGQARGAVLSRESAAGYQTTEKLVVTVGLNNRDAKTLQGTLRVELVGKDGKALAKDETVVRQMDRAASYRFEFPAPNAPAHQLSLRCAFGKDDFTVPLSRILLVKAHETDLISGQEFFSGSPAAIRCEVHGVKSLTETVPLAGAEVAISLKAADGTVYPLLSEKTGSDGKADVRFEVPAVAPGQYTLQVATRSGLGEEKLERKVKVKSDPKILLVSDKPLYQPGQVMHLRALALQAFDLKPVASKELLFEVEDAKGNKVYKRTQPTSEYGIASLDFQLADEVNMGAYQVRAALGEHEARKTVTVKRYVLPKFKVDLNADKRFYLPREVIHADLQTDYFFGKPVAEGKAKVTASTFDVQFRDFQTWEGKTDKDGHAKFEIKLPDYFVGQPLEKGNALVRLEIKVTDAADHTETITRTYPVSGQSIVVSLIPEGGRLVAGMENRVYAAAIYPDGSPAAGTSVSVWQGREAKGKPLATVKTTEAGLAEFTFTPKAEQFRQGQWEQQTVEMLGGQAPAIWGPKSLLDVIAESKDDKGNVARSVAELNASPMGDNVMLRLDKAIYRGGDTMQVDVRTSAGLPTVYLDVIKGGQTLLTRWLDVKDGKAAQRLDLPASVFGTLEVHAYQTLGSGEIVRDSRVIYVHPPHDLKIDVKPDKDVHLPGEKGRIRFEVTDAAGKPTAAALGVIIVDEAVYALQEMQPGLEKVYFTLQEELLKPQVEVHYRPAESINTLVREPVLAAPQQQVAAVLLTSVKPKPPARWEVAPALERRRQVEGQVQQIGWAVWNYATSGNAFMEYAKAGKRWVFKPGLLDNLAAGNRFLAPAALNGPFGSKWTVEELQKLEKDFTPEYLARSVTASRIQQLVWSVANYSNQNSAKWFKGGKWDLPGTVLADAAKNQGLDAKWTVDAWGEPIKLVKSDRKLTNPWGWPQFETYELVSAGPDGKFGTADDVRSSTSNQLNVGGWWWMGGDPQVLLAKQQGQFWGRNGAFRNHFGIEQGQRAMMEGAGIQLPMLAAGAAPQAKAATAPMVADKPGGIGGGGGATALQAGAPPPARVREYFPETMLWHPALITDDRGIAELKVPFADSITTWRLSASASALGGTLGGVSAPLRVFQDFFVDLDLPVSLTQNDEVAFPVAVYNYLKTPQTVKLELQPEQWFELTDDNGLTRSLDLKPNEVTSVKYRIRARRIGFNRLTVKALGSKMSDAIKREIEVVPDGQKAEQVFTDRLTGMVTHTVTIPDQALADSSKILVKIYPGIMSQVLEGTEGMLRLPGG